MHATAASDSQLISALNLSVLSAAVLDAVAVSIIGIVIIWPAAGGVLG